MTKVAFLTDQHISLLQKNPFSVDTQANFAGLLDVIIRRKYDAVVLGGDFCFDKGEQQVYQWFFDKLSALSCPYFVIPGNHDDPSLMASVFQGFRVDQEGQMYYKKSIHQIPFLFLDTSTGRMGETQWRWFEEEVDMAIENRLYIVMHHPPLKAGSKHMDESYAFQEIQKLLHIAGKNPQKSLTVFAGHYHIERQVTFKNVTVFITPSSYVNIDPNTDGFAVLASQKVGFREMVWDEDGLFYTNMVYQD